MSSIPSATEDLSDSDAGYVVPNLLRSLLDTGVIHPEDWHALPRVALDLLATSSTPEALVQHLVEVHLLNTYQAERVQAGTVRGLVLGNYRVLDRIGAGGLGVVFEAEHIQMRRKVAIKVVPLDGKRSPELVARFLREARSVALLHHANIVAAIDAGICHAFNEGELDLYYFVMEHLEGQDLEDYVRAKELSIPEACALIYQAASALDAAHHHNLVHRDIKPSNIFITRDGTAKLLDFGLVRNQSDQLLTHSNDLLGTIEYMAPEQARDATAIDIRADIFALGATLFFTLVGRSPFALEGSVHEVLRRRQTQEPLRAALVRADIPDALDAVMGRMMALNREQRYPTPQAVMHALLPFMQSDTGNQRRLVHDSANGHRAAAFHATTKRSRILIVDHDAGCRREIVRVLAAHEFECVEARSLEIALHELREAPCEVVLIGVDAPETDGPGLLQALRANPPAPNLKVVMMSERQSADELTRLLAVGADDCLCLPISDVQLAARVKSAIQHKDAQDHVDRLNKQLLDLNVDLECGLNARTADFMQARNSLVLALARLVEYRSTETAAHLSRMQRYCTTIAQEASAHPRLAGQIDQDFLQTLECVAPLHDVGNVGLPDAVLLKAGPLAEDERQCMQQHTIIGSETLRQVAHQFGDGAGFLRMAIDVARHHHENYDGTGYPDQLKGDEIPLAARIVAVADGYDSLRSRRAQRPRLSHSSAVQIMLDASPGKFDPILLSAFQTCAAQLDRIYRDVPDSFGMD